VKPVLTLEELSQEKIKSEEEFQKIQAFINALSINKIVTKIKCYQCL